MLRAARLCMWTEESQLEAREAVYGIFSAANVSEDKEDVAETGPLAIVLAAVKWLVARLASPAGTS